jgi:hypothetical protein
MVHPRASGSPPPTPPLGLTAWSDSSARDVAILLDRAATVDEVAEQIPRASERPAGSLVVVLGELASSGARLARWLRPRARVERSLRSTALLARGYERLGGALDSKTGIDVAWGYAPEATSR